MQIEVAIQKEMSYAEFGDMLNEMFGIGNIHVERSIVADGGAEVTHINHKDTKTRIASYAKGNGFVYKGVEHLYAKNEPKTIKPPRKAAPKKVKAEKKESKSSKALAIYKEMEGAARKDVIARYISELGMSKAGASTYYQNAKKAA